MFPWIAVTHWSHQWSERKEIIQDLTHVSTILKRLKDAQDRDTVEAQAVTAVKKRGKRFPIFLSQNPA